MDLTAVAIVLGAGGLVWAVFSTRDALLVALTEREPQEPVHDDSETRSRLAELEARLEETRAAVAQGIQHVERTERRIKATIRRAMEEHEEGGSPALRSEAEQLGLLDGTGSDVGGVQPLPAEVGPDRPSSIPGVSAEQLARARGF